MPCPCRLRGGRGIYLLYSLTLRKMRSGRMNAAVLVRSVSLPAAAGVMQLLSAAAGPRFSSTPASAIAVWYRNWPGGSVRLCARRETGRLTLTVQDTGRGMDAETLAHIGEPFYRPDKARSREQGGAGLGLALCFQIAQSHGAALSFTSAPGAGTTAAVIFTA